MQTLAIMFNGKPIAFSKGKFADTALGKLINRMKDNITKAKNAINNFFNEEFINPIKAHLQTLDGLLASPFERVNKFLEEKTANDYAELKSSLPLLFSNTSPSVANARSVLLDRLGKVNDIASNTSYSIGPFSIGELTTLALEADSLSKSFKDYEQHTDALSGLGGSDVRYRLQRIYGSNQLANSTVNVSSGSVVVTPNTSSTAYPVVNIGDIIIINTEEKLVIDKGFTANVTGTVSVDVSADNVKVTTASVATLNLANELLSTSGTLTVNTGMFISVNGEVRQVNTINVLGDYLTVYVPFYNSVTGATFNKETSYNVNTAFASTSTSQTVNVKSEFVCNSVCLDNVITGVGTSFTGDLVANNKIIYDSKEYYVVSVTDNTITVDEPLRFTQRFPVYKVNDEYPYLNLTEDFNDPDAIVTAFTLPGQLMGDRGYLDGLTTRVRRANGVYETVSASKPTDSAQSLFQQSLMSRTEEILNTMMYDLRDDAIRSLTESEVVTRINETVTRITNVRDDIKNVVQQDIQVYNQVKGLVKGMIKLFTMSCSKKKRKDEPTQPDDDDYFDLILKPNPFRQGCDATQSDFIDILDDIDAEYNNPEVSSNNVPIVSNSVPVFDANGLDGLGGPFPTQPIGTVGTDTLDGNIDATDPDVNVPEDPCAKPC